MPVRRIEFVEVRSPATTAGAGHDQRATGAAGAAGAVAAVTRADVALGVGPGDARWSLWDEGER